MEKKNTERNKEDLTQIESDKDHVVGKNDVSAEGPLLPDLARCHALG